ncbi:MAG: hypothetical protein KDD47_25065 [Acidobacteria bacterium]|nr:hypothetical protein [Acidobacteriota bacterium]
MATSAPSAWQTLTTPPPDGLVDARQQLHWAAQVASSVGKTLLEKQPDDSQKAFSWIAGHHCMASAVIPAAQPFRIALRPSDLHLLVLSDHDVEQMDFPLSGRTIEQAFHWLEDDVRRQLGRPLPTPLTRPTEIEAHPVGEGARFSVRDHGAFEELARYFANADLLLEEHAAGRPGASAIRIWPHHFDIAVLITVEGNEDPEKARMVGVGMSPGDGEAPLPYLYVTPWPYPEKENLPALPAGHWHREKWVGAVLPADQLATGDGEAQESRAAEFLDIAIEACLGLL